jgi:hypothetical protein
MSQQSNCNQANQLRNTVLDLNSQTKSAVQVELTHTVQKFQTPTQ